MKLDKTYIAVAAVVAMVGAILLGPRIWRLMDARAAAEIASDGLAAALATEAQIGSLRAASPAWLSRAKPTADVAALVQNTLRELDMPATVLAEVTPQEASIRPGSRASGIRWGEQTVLLRLAPRPLPELGTILDRWRSDHPEWSIRSIDLQATERAGASGGVGWYGATVRLTASYVE